MSIKKTLENKLQSRLDEWKSEIDRVEAKARNEKARAEAEKADAKLQRELWSTVDALKSKADAAGKQLAQLKDATEEQANSLKNDVEQLVA